jgi:signal peptidase I
LPDLQNFGDVPFYRKLDAMTKNDHAMAARNAVGKKKDEGIWETFKVIVQALLIAFVVRTFFFQPYNIPSPSMYPTLKVGDYLFVSKLSYGYGKYSFNFSVGGFFGAEPWFKCCPVDFPGRKVLADVPKRGDVAVFKLPSNTDIDYIKRVIGLPGDQVQMREGVLYINNVAVKKERIEDYVDHDSAFGGRPLAQYLETLPNGVKYKVLDKEDYSNMPDNTDVYTVPEGHYFMLGDNRDNSSDSRYFPEKDGQGVGFVPLENFMGRADILFFSISSDASLWRVWEWPFLIRWARFFNFI